MRYANFVGPSNRLVSPIQDQEQTVNLILEQAQSRGAASEIFMRQIPGYTLAGQVDQVVGRASFAQGRCFVVIGTGFYELTLSGPNMLSAILHGTVAVDSNPATICTNGDGGGQIFITSGDNGYIFDLNSSAFSQERTGGTTMGAVLDGYFIALDAATSTFFLSDLNDGTVWDPTQFAQRSIAPDPWVAIAVIYQDIWLFGTQTSEIWYDTGESPFPFAPRQSGLVPFGIAAPFSVKVVAGSLVWLSQTANGENQVVRAFGFTPEVVSTYAVHYALDHYARVDDSIGDTWEHEGHTFYRLTVPSGNVAWRLDVGPNYWTEDGTWIAAENRFAPPRTVFHFFAFSQHWFLDRQTGQMWRMDSDVYTDADDLPLRWLRRAPALSNQNKRQMLSELEIVMEVGVGTNVGQGFDPQMMIRFSRDGGMTWGPELLRSIGKTGEYETRVLVNRLPMARKFVPEISGSDPVPVRISYATINANIAELDQPQQVA